MKVNNNKLTIINVLLVTIMLLSILIIPWYNGNILNKYVYLFLLVYIMFLMFKFKYFKNISIYGYIIIALNALVVIANLFVNGIQENSFRSIVFWTYVNLLVIIFFCILESKKSSSLKIFIDKYLFIIFNSYFLINVPIIVEQINHKYFMMRYISGNTLYKDHITGLIGQSGTHVLSFFWICLIIINLYKISNKKNPILILLTVFELTFMIIISSYNDNTAFYFLIIIALIEFYLDKLLNTNIKTMLKYIVIIIGVILIFMVAKNYNSNLQKFYEKRILVKFEQYFGQNTKSDYGDEERIALYKYDLKNGNGYKLGMGIGSVKSEDPKLPKHFAVSEISLKTYEGGIIFLISVIALYVYFANKLLNVGKGGLLVLIFNFSLFSVYTTIFRDFRLIFLFTMIILIYRYNHLELFKKYNSNNKN